MTTRSAHGPPLTILSKTVRPALTGAGRSFLGWSSAPWEVMRYPSDHVAGWNCHGGVRSLDPLFCGTTIYPRAFGPWRNASQSRGLCFLLPLFPQQARSEEHTSELQSQSNLVCL